MTILAIAILSSIFIGLMIGLFFFISTSTGRLNSSLNELAKQINASGDLKTTVDAIANLNKDIGDIANESKRISFMDKNILELKNIFIVPSQAGAAGQTLLDKALSDVLGSQFYEAQYTLSTGRVDYVLKFKECLIPIDSKLSIENFRKMLAADDHNQKRALWKTFTGDVKKRIDETSKYILPAEKTTDFAFMYIASEAVYYEAFVRPQQFGEDNNIYEYAIKKRVFPVSPQTITPFLHTIVIGLKALKIEQAAKEISNKITALHNEFEKFKNIYLTIKNHISDAQNRMSDGSSKIDVIGHHISSLEIKETKEP